MKTLNEIVSITLLGAGLLYFTAGCGAGGGGGGGVPELKKVTTGLGVTICSYFPQSF